MDSQNPLWLPQGSVRAILTLGLTLVVSACCFIGVALPEYVQTVWAGLVGHYIATRANGSSKPK